VIEWSGLHSALDPFGPQAARVHGLWRFLWIVSLAVYVLVIAALAWAALRRRTPAEADPTPRPAAEVAGPALRTTIVGATVATVLILFVFLVVDLATGRPLTAAPRGGRGALEIEVTGHQWWWQVEYPSSRPDLRVVTANEIHVPTGRPVVVTLTSTDVIHSFWPPSLVGKRDMIPGEKTSVWFQADTPGVYRGQCAEFCGYQHAKMAFQIVAEPAEQFERWMARQRDSARTPTDSLALRGQEVFLATSCVMCHTVRGTPAGSRIGPDLTHLASRRTIAAGSLPNTRGALAGWIVDPQSIKPGTRMPSNQIEPDDLQALLAYLESLK